MGLTESTATRLLALNSLDVLPNSAVSVEGTQVGLVWSGQRVAVLAPSGSQVLSGFEGESSATGDRTLLLGPTRPANLDALRELRPWMRPRPLGTRMSAAFGVTERLTGENAQGIYDHLQERLASPEYAPRALFETFGVEVLCTTDAATDTLEHHATLRAEGWGGRVRPTFRPDAVTDLSTAGWRHNIDLLSQASGIDVVDYRSFLEALQERRYFFKEMGAVATDHSATTPHTERLSETEVQGIFARALSGESSSEDAARFTANMLVEMAGMSAEDGLVMQLHAGSLRNHNTVVHRRFGLDSGADIPIVADWTRGLRAILDERGNDPRFRLVVFGLDEAAYPREIAPLAGHYPALLLGAPWWWFFDSSLGMRRYLDAVIETAGLYNTAGFNDDTRAFASMPPATTCGGA